MTYDLISFIQHREIWHMGLSLILFCCLGPILKTHPFRFFWIHCDAHCLKTLLDFDFYWFYYAVGSWNQILKTFNDFAFFSEIHCDALCLKTSFALDSLFYFAGGAQFWKLSTISLFLKSLQRTLCKNFIRFRPSMILFCCYLSPILKTFNDFTFFWIHHMLLLFLSIFKRHLIYWIIQYTSSLASLRIWWILS